jgi:hypothetical protein
MSNRITIENGVEYTDRMHSVYEVRKFKGTSWTGGPVEVARVPEGQHTSRRNAKFDETDDIMFGLHLRKAHYDSDHEFTGSFYDEELAVRMTKEEAIQFASTILDAALGRGF